MFGNITNNKSNIYERDWSKFDQVNFPFDYFFIVLQVLLKTYGLTQSNLEKIYICLHTHAPLKKIDKYKLIFKFEPWMALFSKNQSR